MITPSTFSRRAMLSGMTAAGALLLGLGPVSCARTASVVRTTHGPLTGSQESADVVVFKGIPYAAPPVGPLRFRPPQPLQPWQETRAATTFGPHAVQPPPEVGTRALPPISEDCLYLNIWTPAADRALRPVFFYIHGGAFIAGSGASPNFHGGHLARNEDIVTVTVNYRLGVLGFPPFKAVGDDTPSNLGILDIIAALRWVRDNIAAFGGDPDNITIGGLSAGGWLVAALMAAPQARGLFHKAILQSPCTMNALTAEEEAHHRAVFLSALGSGSADLSALLTLSADHLLDAQAKTVQAWESSRQAVLRGDACRPFIPLRDGLVLTDDPLAVIQRQEAADIPVLVGTTSQEIDAAPFRMTLPWLANWYRKESVLTALAATGGEHRAHQVYNGYLDAFPQATEAEVGGMIRSDWSYRIPAIRAAEATAGNRPTWMYRFDYKAPAIGIATHATDMAFWFGNIDSELTAFFLGRGPNPDEAALSRAMQRDLAAFARHGQVDWPAYSEQQRSTKIYDLTPRTADDPGAATRRLWSGII